MAIYYEQENIPETLAVGDILDFSSQVELKKIILPIGQYKLEAWGASGGNADDTIVGGLGGYATGVLSLDEATEIFITVGAVGTAAVASTPTAPSSWANGVMTYGTPSIGGGGHGLAASVRAGGISYGASGGGGTHIHVGSSSPYARVLVAGGGGGSSYMQYWNETGYGGNAGNDLQASVGTSGSSDMGHTAQGAVSYQGGVGDYSYGANFTQSDGGLNVSGSFYHGGSYTLQYKIANLGDAAAGGGGGGWYGGASGVHNAGGGGGGTGFAYTAASYMRIPEQNSINAITKSTPYSLLHPKYQLTDAVVYGGDDTFLDPAGYEVQGYRGQGHIKITVVSTTPREEEILTTDAENISSIISVPVKNITSDLTYHSGEYKTINSISFDGLNEEYKNMLKQYSIYMYNGFDTTETYNQFNQTGTTVYINPNGRVADTIGSLPEGAEILINKNNIPTVFKIAKHNYSAISTETAPTHVTCLMQTNNHAQRTFSFFDSTFVLYDLVDAFEQDLEEYPTELQDIIVEIPYHTSMSASVGSWINADYQPAKIFYPSVSELGFGNYNGFAGNDQGSCFISIEGLYNNITQGDLITRTIDTNAGTLALFAVSVPDIIANSTEFTGLVANCFCIPMTTPVKRSSNGEYYELDI